MKHDWMLGLTDWGKYWPKGLRIFALLFILMLTALPSWAQDRDSLLAIVDKHLGDSTEVKAYVNLYRADRRSDPETAFQYLNDGLELARKINFKRGEGLVLRAMGDHFLSHGDPDKSIEVLNESRAIFEALADTQGIISCLNGLGNTAVQAGNHLAAIDYYLTTAKLNEKGGDLDGMAVSYQNLGGVHYRLQQFDTALDFIEKALAIKEAMKDSLGLIASLNAKSSILSAQGNVSMALEVLLHTLAIAEKVSDIYEIGSMQNNIGVQYQLLGKPDSARIYYMRGLEINRRLDLKQDLIIAYYNLGEIALELKNDKQALLYYDSSLVIAQQIGAKQFEAEVYRGLARVNKSMGKFELAYDWLDKHYQLRDSLTGEAVKLQINDLQEKYESGKKDIEIAGLKEMEADARTTAERRKFWLLFAISVGLLVVLATLWINARRKAREATRRTQLEHKALRAQMNPHFIFNSLGAIQEMYMSGDTDLANNYLGDFGKLLRKILENSGRETTTIKEELEMLRLYLGLEKERNSGMIEYLFEIDERIDQSGTHIPPMVIQPIVENAIWHGILPSRRKGTIIIRMKLANKVGTLYCEIEDNGVGMAQSKKNQDRASLGMQITEQRLGTSAKIEHLSPGTRVTLTIQL